MGVEDRGVITQWFLNLKSIKNSACQEIKNRKRNGVAQLPIGMGS